MSGDCETTLLNIEDKTVDSIITSPPYADMKKYENFDGVETEKYSKWFLPKVKQFSRVLKDSGSFILNINDKVEDRMRSLYVFKTVIDIVEQTDFKLFERLFWDKGKYLPHSKRFGDRVEYIFWFVKNKNFYIDMDAMRVPYNEKSIKRMEKPIKKRFARSVKNNVEYKDWSPNVKGALPSSLIKIGSESKKISDKHFAVYPIKLAEYFIKGSTKEGDVVLDPFVGTGTTGLASIKNNRRFIGCDISEEYCKIAKQRMSTEGNLL